MRSTKWALRIGMLLGVAGCTAPSVEESSALEVAGHAEALGDLECTLLESYANGDKHQEVLDRMNERLTGINTPVGVRDGKEIRIQGVESVSFAGCRATMTLRVKLRRPGIRRDANGTMVVKGDVYPARRNVYADEIVDGTIVGESAVVEDQICLRNMDVDSVDLSHLSDAIGQPIFEWYADKQDASCYGAGALWSDVEQAIAPFLIPFEQSPDKDTRSGWPIGTHLCDGQPCPAPAMEACQFTDDLGMCIPCVYVDDTCVPCAWNGASPPVCVPPQA